VYNDIDGNVVNFLMQVRKDPKTIQKACESIPYSRALYEKWKTEDYPTDDFDWAVQCFISTGPGSARETWRMFHKPDGVTIEKAGRIQRVAI